MKRLSLLMIIGVIIMMTVNVNAETTRDLILRTNLGDIEIELYPEVAPKIVANFIKLAEEGFYDGIYFHRVIPNFMIQGGCPNTKDGNRQTDGTGGPGYQIPDEINANSLGLHELKVRDSVLANQIPPDHPYSEKSVKEIYEMQGYSYNDNLTSLPNHYGYLSMANAGPNTNGSQFFVITAREGTPWLDGKHTVFGKVTNGMEIVHQIESLDRDQRDNPLEENQAIIQSVLLR